MDRTEMINFDSVEEFVGIQFFFFFLIPFRYFRGMELERNQNLLNRN